MLHQHWLLLTILAPFAGDPRPDCGRSLLADPYMDQATEFDNTEEYRQQHERDR